MTDYVLRCNRCGYEERHSRPVWEDWFVPRCCEQPAPSETDEDRVCGGTLIRLPDPPPA